MAEDPSGCDRYSVNIDLAGHDIGVNLGVRTADECRRKCEQKSGCTSWTYLTARQVRLKKNDRKEQ